VKTLRIATVVAAIAVTLAGCVAEEQASGSRGTVDGFTPSVTPSTEEPVEETPVEETGATTEGDCKFQADGAQEPVAGLPPDQGPVAATSVALTTSAGPITIQLDAQRGPCTVQSIVHLAGAGYFDDTICHRLTASAALKVLQCGDPEGTGRGGPGYRVPDEPPAGLAPGPELSDGTPTVIYPRGIVAMANGGAGTTGSQFFLVYGDSTLPANYNIVGTLDEAALATLDQIAAGGITPGDSTEEGAPATEVTITSAVAA
jgi:peptidyl-prolyl cis-trans isomerase B (cyclophilin B)